MHFFKLGTSRPEEAGVTAAVHGNHNEGLLVTLSVTDRILKCIEGGNGQAVQDTNVFERARLLGWVVSDTGPMV